MCFSPQADLVGGLVISAIGIDVIRQVRDRHHLALAALPLLFGVHQLDETFVWLGLQNHVPHTVQTTAMWMYLLFAFVVLPIYVPVAAFFFETSAWRRRVMLGFAAIGITVSAILAINMITGHVTARMKSYHLAYGVGVDSGFLIVGAYVAATCGSLLLASNRAVTLFGLINIVAVAALVHLALDGFASLWCAWAAMSSATVVLYLRIHRTRSSDLRIIE